MVWKLTSGAGQDRGCQSLHLDPREDEEAAVVDAALNRRLSIAASIGGNGSWSAPSRAMQIRQRQQSLMLESFQQQATLVVFQPAIGPLPVQPLADRARDFGDS